MKNKIREILKEQAGISSVVRQWSDVLYSEIMDNPQEHHGKGRLIIDGYEFEVYDELPIDYFVIDFYDTMTGYDQTKSGYDDNGYYVVVLYVQPTLIKGSHSYSLKSALNHELKHAYQDYMRVSKGYGNVDTTKESKSFYTEDFIKLLNSGVQEGPIKNILRFYYYLSDLERDAYLENVYDGNNEYVNKVRTVLNTDFNYFKRYNDLESNWDYISNLNIPLVNKFKDPESFIDYSNKILKAKAEKIIKKINKMKYIHKLK